jgi:DNA-directed RNA polymerase specialized sigma24 family protein
MALPIRASLSGDWTDEELVERAKKGCEASFRSIMLRYQQKLLNFAARRYGLQEAHEYAHQTFIKFHRSLQRYEERGLLFPYLLRICSTLPPGGQGPNGGSPERELASIPAKALLAPDLLIMEEDGRRALSALSRLQLQVVLMRAYGLSWGEIAEQLEIPLETAISRYKAAKKELWLRRIALKEGLPFHPQLSSAEARDCVAEVLTMIFSRRAVL